VSILRLFFLFCASTIILGCASTPNEPLDHLSWQQRSAQLSQLNHWRVKGKIAVRTTNQSESGSLIWQNSEQNTHITLSGPLGLGATTIDSDGKELVVSHKGVTRRYDVSSNQAAMANIGWDLPLSSLTHWIKGLPAPHSDVYSEIIEQGLWRQLIQDGWTVTFERYAQFQHYTLPTRLTVERGDTRARLILSHWMGLPNR
jgi:outer membrane lipoprotein LolB